MSAYFSINLLSLAIVCVVSTAVILVAAAADSEIRSIADPDSKIGQIRNYFESLSQNGEQDYASTFRRATTKQNSKPSSSQDVGDNAQMMDSVINQLAENNEELKEELESLRRNEMQIKASLKESLEREKTENMNLVKQLEMISSDKKRLADERKNLASDFETQLSNLQRELDDTKNALSHIKREAADKNCLIADLTASSEKIKNNLQAKESELDEVTSATRKAHEEELKVVSSGYESKLASIENNLNEFTRGMTDQNALIESLTASLLEAKGKLKQKSQEIAKLKQIISVSKSLEEEELKKVTDSYESQLTKKMKDLELMLECKAQLDEEKNRLSQCRSESKTKIDELQVIIDENKSQVTKLENELDELKGTKKKKEEPKKTNDNCNSKYSCPYGNPNCRGNCYG